MNLPDSFRHYGEAVLAKYPVVVHQWVTKPYCCELSIPSQSQDGFDIRFDVVTDDLTLFWGNGHTHFVQLDDVKALVEELFGLLRDMLSPDMRIRQHYAGGKPYLAQLESFDGTNWSVERSSGLLFWNFFAKRSVKTYMNAVLPGRLATGTRHHTSAALQRPE